MSRRLASSGGAVGPYDVLEPIGEGGMGVVYAAVHRSTGMRVALKTVRVPRAWLLASIRREIRALTRLVHPGIVRIVGEGVEAGVPWYAMEMVEGTSLRRHPFWGADVVRRSAPTREDPARTHPDPASDVASFPTAGDARLPAASRDVTATPAWLEGGLGVMRRLCGILAYLHGEGFVHGDLKPDNVIVRPDGSPVVMDFGLVARFAGSVSREVLEEQVAIGTVAYMAPEQARGELVDARADLYALGCMLYELLTGRPPFFGSSALDVSRSHASVLPTSPSLLVDGVPPELERLILGLLAKRPNERIGHADVVLDALRSLGHDTAGGDGGEAPARSYLYRPGFQGRDDALATLAEETRGAMTGRLSVALVGGESGAGKTRLAMAFAARAPRELSVIECASVPPVAPLHALLPMFVAIGDHCRERGDAEAERILGKARPVLDDYVPALADLPGRARRTPAADLPVDAARLRLASSVGDVLQAFARERPILLVLDDLQWADDVTLEVLRHLLRTRASRSMAVMVLGTYRSEERGAALDRLLSEPGVVSIPLARLSDADVGRIAGDMMGDVSPPPDLAGFLARQSNGNPFFVSEYLRTAVAEGALVRDGAGRWRLARARSYEALGLPGAIRELVARRLDRIDPGVRGTLSAAAVIGGEIDPALLGAVAGRLEPEREREIAQLLSRQILEETPGGLRFLHAEIQAAAFARLSAAERQSLHERVAVGLAARSGDADPALLARHWIGAGRAELARPLLLLAARRAVSRYAYEDGERLYREYLALHDGDSAGAVDARIELGRMWLIAGRTEDALASFLDAVPGARRAGDLRREAEALRGAGTCRNRLGRGDAVDALRDVLALCERSGDRAGEAVTLRGLGTALWDEGRFAEGKELLERALGIFRELDDGAGAAGVLSTLAASYRGDLEQVRRWSDEALAIYRKLGDRHGEATCLAQLAGLVIEMGRPEEGEALVLASQEILRDVGDHSMIAFGYEIQAFLARQASTLDRSLSYLEKALGIHQFTGDRRMEGRLRGLVGFVRWDRGDRRGGSESFDQGLAMLREARELSVQADFLRIRSSYERLLTGDLPSAERWVARAEEIMREIGDLVGLALCRCERASIALASGDVAACREHLDGARAASADAALGTAGTLRTRIVEVEQALGAIERGDGSLLFRGDLKSRVPPALLDA